MAFKRNEKFIQAVSFIYQNIDAELTLQQISDHINVSKASLKRLFNDAVNIQPGQFIRKMRMELAFTKLQQTNESVLEIALASGFEDQSAFIRCFKDNFGYTPKKAREKINIVNELDKITLEEPDIMYLEKIDLQCVTEKGLYFECAPKAWQNLQTKLTKNELSDDFSGLFIGIGHDNPHEGNVAPDQVRFSACISHVSDNLGVDKISIEPGNYARFRYLGKPNNLGLAYHYIFGAWCEKSKYVIDSNRKSFTCFEKFPEANSDERIIINVPINID